MTDTSPTASRSIESRLDEILLHMERMDRRDRLRTFGGFLRGMMALVPMLFFLWSLWYVYKHGDELMKKIATTAASSAAEITKGQTQNLYNDVLKAYQIPKR